MADTNLSSLSGRVMSWTVSQAASPHVNLARYRTGMKCNSFVRVDDTEVEQPTWTWPLCLPLQAAYNRMKARLRRPRSAGPKEHHGSPRRNSA
jgi:hypothetical protein